MADDSNKSPERAFQELLEREDQAKQELESLPYDGVRGLPPDWIPAPAIDRFRRTRDYLLGISDCDFLADQIAAALKEGEPVIPGTADDPQAYLRAIDELAHVRYAVSLGESKGLQVIAGDDSSLGHKRRGQMRDFGSRGAETQQSKGADTRQKVLTAAKEILASRQRRRPSGRELARLVEERTGIPQATARTHIRWLREHEFLD